VPTVPAPPTTAGEKPAKSKRAKAKRKMPPPQVVAAVALLAVALELLIWQVGGPRWGVPIHTVLAVLILAAVPVLLMRRRRRGQPRNRKRRDDRRDRRRVADLLQALRRASVVRKPTADGGGPGGTGSRIRRALSALGGRRPGGTGSDGRPSKKDGRTSGTGGGRMRTAMDAIRRATRTTGGESSSRNSESRRRRPRGPKQPKDNNRRDTKAPDRTKKKRRRTTPGDVWAAITRPAQPSKNKNDATKKQPAPAAPSKKADKPAAEKKPQPPTNERLVKEAVKRAADATPAPIPPARTGGTAMGDMNKIRNAADELAAALKDYDPEDMHQFAREVPGLADSLNAISGGLRHVASRAESEWPTAAPVAEGIRTMADDIRAAAGTAEATRGTLHRENEADIERGVAPRHGSHRAEARWNVNGNS